MQLHRAYQCSIIAVLASATIALGADRSRPLTRSCGGDAVANTNNVLCAPPSGPCTPTSVVIGASIDVTDAGCEFDLGGRTLAIESVMRMTGLGFIAIENAGSVSIAATGALKARGDFVHTKGAILPGGIVSITSSGTITLAGGATIDVSGDGGGEVNLSAAGADADGVGITLERGSVIQGNGQASGTDTDPFADGASVGLIATTGAIFDGATINVRGTPQGGGGDVDIFAVRGVTVAGAITSTGGGGGGGVVDVEAGDALVVSKTIDVSSLRGGGEGGSIILAGGSEEAGNPGAVAGGDVTLDMARHASLKADGSDGDGAGGDGGDITIIANGSVNFINAGSRAAVHADAGPTYAGSGGFVDIETGDADSFTVGPLDGDIVLNGPIHAVSGRLGGSGGAVAIAAGRSAVVNSDITLSGVDGGGVLDGQSGATALLNGTIDLHGTTATSGPGTLDFAAGLAQGGVNGALTIAKSVLASGGANSGQRGVLLFAGCTLTVNAGVKIDGSGAISPLYGVSGDDITLVSAGPMTLTATSRYLARPFGFIQLTHPPADPPQTAGAIFNRPPLDDPTPFLPGVYPNCPVCGDGIRENGEVCDNAASADGACCNATCSAFICP